MKYKMTFLEFLNEAKTPFTSKDTNRILDIIDKANGDRNQENRLATSMANKIKDADKALARGLAAEDNNYHNVAEIFFAREKELRIVH